MADEQRQKLEEELASLQAQMQAMIDEKVPWNVERYSMLLEMYKVFIKCLDQYTTKYQQDEDTN
jgi:hypothetical protein